MVLKHWLPDKGIITIDQAHPILTSASSLASIRAMAMQNQSFNLGFTVREIVEMGGASDEVLHALGLSEIADRLVTTLSGGESQRVAIAQAIAQRTPVLLLDEPLAAQDVASRKRIIELLQQLAEKGTTVVVVAHSTETELTWADKVIKQFH